MSFVRRIRTQGESLLTQQFVIDSQLFKDSGDYYLAISELQLVNINNVRNGHPSQEDRAAISQGRSYLTSSLNTVQDAVAKGTNLLAATANTPCNFLAGERRTAKDTLNSAKRLTEILGSLLESRLPGLW
jgi:hypothetical protein